MSQWELDGGDEDVADGLAGSLALRAEAELYERRGDLAEAERLRRTADELDAAP